MTIKKNKTLFETTHYIGKISNLQDSLILCHQVSSDRLRGEIVYVQKKPFYRGIVFERNFLKWKSFSKTNSRRYSTNTNKPYDINIVSFELDIFVIPDIKAFNNLSFKEKQHYFSKFLVNQVFAKELEFDKMNPPIEIYITENNLHHLINDTVYYFFDIIDYKEHYFEHNNMQYHFYSIWFMTNNCFLNVNNNCFSINLYCHTFKMNYIPGIIEDFSTLTVKKEYLEQYLFENEKVFSKYIKENTLKDLHVDFLDNMKDIRLSQPVTASVNSTLLRETKKKKPLFIFSNVKRSYVRVHVGSLLGKKVKITDKLFNNNIKVLNTLDSSVNTTTSECKSNASEIEGIFEKSMKTPLFFTKSTKVKMNDIKIPHYINGKGVFNLVKIENTTGVIQPGFVVDIHTSIKHQANKDKNIDILNIKNHIKSVHSKGEYTTSLDPTDSQYVCSIPSSEQIFKALPDVNDTFSFNIKKNASERQGNQEEILKAYELIKQSGVHIDISIFKDFDNFSNIYFANTEKNCNFLTNKKILLPKEMHIWHTPEEIYSLLTEYNVSVTDFYFFLKNKKNVPETNTNQLNITSNHIKHDNNKFKAAFNFNEDLFE